MLQVLIALLLMALVGSGVWAIWPHPPAATPRVGNSVVGRMGAFLGRTLRLVGTYSLRALRFLGRTLWRVLRFLTVRIWKFWLVVVGLGVAVYCLRKAGIIQASPFAGVSEEFWYGFAAVAVAVITVFAVWETAREALLRHAAKVTFVVLGLSGIYWCLREANVISSNRLHTVPTNGIYILLAVLIALIMFYVLFWSGKGSGSGAGPKKPLSKGAKNLRALLFCLGFEVAVLFALKFWYEKTNGDVLPAVLFWTFVIVGCILIITVSYLQDHGGDTSQIVNFFLIGAAVVVIWYGSVLEVMHITEQKPLLRASEQVKAYATSVKADVVGNVTGMADSLRAFAGVAQDHGYPPGVCKLVLNLYTIPAGYAYEDDTAEGMDMCAYLCGVGTALKKPMAPVDFPRLRDPKVAEKVQGKIPAEIKDLVRRNVLSQKSADNLTEILTDPYRGDAVCRPWYPKDG